MKHNCKCGGCYIATDPTNPMVAQFKCDCCGDVRSQRKRQPAQPIKCATCGGLLRDHNPFLRHVHLEMAANYKKTVARLKKVNATRQVTATNPEI